MPSWAPSGRGRTRSRTGRRYFPDGKRLYVAYRGAGVVAVIDSAIMTLITTVDAGPSAPRKVAITPSGARVYVTENTSGEVSVIGTATNTVVVPIPVNQGLDGVEVPLDGKRVYVADRNNARVAVIDAATNSVVTVGARRACHRDTRCC
ncbi:YncE family protein [Streptomyces virginiae]|uniref:YncE family protein n=1 Tax=Streptomyces virginiae TaxID=1961 RepID=UPI002DBC70E0|nr:YncE family protein [Streptomyces sp. CMAA1738]MEC4570224.1 YncE family protein [Streptomyces sp. CMAA1738]